MGADEGVDLFARERPVVVEIGDHRFHEWFAELDRPLLVAQAIEQDGERKLLRAVALVAPLETESGEPLDLVVLVELCAVDRYDETIDRALALGVALGDRACLIGVQPRTERQIRRLAIVHVPKAP